MLAAIDVSVSFGGVLAVDQVSLALEPGQVLAVVGPNGSGKTTLLNAIGGLVARSGRVKVDDTVLAAGSAEAARCALVVRTFQTPQVVDELSCLDNVLLATADRKYTGLLASWFARPRMLAHERNRWAAAHDAVDRFGLADQAGLAADQLSYGQRRWLELARASLAKPRYLLADEPSAGLNDVETERLATHLRDFRDSGTGLILVDHKVAFLRAVADRALVLSLGQVIADDTIEAVWHQPAVREAYLGTRRVVG